eukprot:7942079-Pyramimonas_sp.AAC.1
MMIGLGNVRLNQIKGGCDACRERRAWDKPGHTVMPSAAPPGKFNEEVECDLMFHNQEHHIFHIIDRCMRYAPGMETRQDYDNYHEYISSVLDAVWTCKGTRLRRRGCP